MDADWYIDPLGRFDGRFFDGERWTERVSDAGALVIDEDFPPPDPADQSGESDQSVESDEDFSSAAPAVHRVDLGRHLQASLIEESPVRVVAVLDASVTPAVAGSATDQGQGSSRTPIVWGLLALIAALVVAGLVLISGNDSTPVAESVELDREQEARVEDLEAGGATEESDDMAVEELEVDAPAGVVAPGTTFDPSETIDVGGLQIINGESMLTELRAWHADFAAERGVVLAPTASCWFGQLGGGAAQLAHCGPVGGSATTEFLYDSVPLVFEDATGGQVAQPVVDAASIDVVLPNALMLVGVEGDIPPDSAEG